MTQSHMRPLGRTGLSVCPLGFGCYRITDGNAMHEAALRAYLERGGNLIDTSANYADGLSEQLVGRVLKDYPRERVIVVTKGGYIQGRNMALARERSFPEVVSYADGLWHCIHPEFLETQLRLSAERLGVETIDVYLLHNPEYFLTEIAHHHPPAASDHDEFYRRIGQAFRFLEQQVREGKLRWYGISSNHFGLPSSEPTMTSVARCLDAANAVAADHHFAVVQLPLNLYESGGALEPNTDGRTVLGYCRLHGIGVLANRPLNAFSDGRLTRLADFVAPGTTPPGAAELTALLEPLRRHEEQFIERFSDVKREQGSVTDLLARILPAVKSTAHFEQVADAYILSPIQQWLAAVHQQLGAQPAWLAWQRECVDLLNRLFEEIARHLTAQQQATSDRVRRRLIQAGYPEAVPPEPLSRMAIRVLLSLPGLSSVLVGMRRPEYVGDVAGLASAPSLDGEKLLRAFEAGADPGARG